MSVNRYLYKPRIRNTRWLLLVFSVVFFLIGLVFVPEIFSMVTGQLPFNKSEFYNAVQNLFWLSVWSPLFWAFINNLYPDVFINDGGLQIVTIRKFDIPWDDIVEIKPANLFGLFHLKKNEGCSYETKNDYLA